MLEVGTAEVLEDLSVESDASPFTQQSKTEQFFTCHFNIFSQSSQPIFLLLTYIHVR